MLGWLLKVIEIASKQEAAASLVWIFIAIIAALAFAHILGYSPGMSLLAALIGGFLLIFYTVVKVFHRLPQEELRLWAKVFGIVVLLYLVAVLGAIFSSYTIGWPPVLTKVLISNSNTVQFDYPVSAIPVKTSTHFKVNSDPEKWILWAAQGAIPKENAVNERLLYITSDPPFDENYRTFDARIGFADHKLFEIVEACAFLRSSADNSEQMNYREMKVTAVRGDSINSYTIQLMNPAKEESLFLILRIRKKGEAGFYETPENYGVAIKKE